MKKVTCLLVLLAMATSVSADVIFTGDGTDSVLSLSYTTTGGDLPRGFALKCAVLNGDLVTIDPCDITVPGINSADLTNIDYAFTKGTYTIGEGHPMADPCNPGVLSDTTDIDYFSVCFGVLDSTGNQGAGPATADPLIEIPIDLGSDPCVYIIVDEDNLRGGVAGSQLTTNLPIIVKVVPVAVPTECVKSDAPFYTAWVGGAYWSKPDCWCFQRNCRGDADGIKSGPFWVAISDLNIFRTGYNKLDNFLTQTSICADFDHIKTGPFRVAIPDLNIFRAYYNKIEVPFVPACPMDWDGDSDNDYNFWTN